MISPVERPAIWHPFIPSTPSSVQSGDGSDLLLLGNELLAITLLIPGVNPAAELSIQK
jgi:hypothetical protein